MARIAGWGRYPTVEGELRPARTRADVPAAMVAPRAVIARGNGRSYGDAAIGTDVTLDMLPLDRMMAFDPETGLLKAEAGVLLSEVIDAFLPRGFFPVVVPGTRYVSVGGAIAADVHGKNHHRDGSFGDHVEALTLVTGTGEVITASRQENADVFFATTGGMGLTGTILDATFRLRRVETGWVRQTTRVAANLGAAMDALDAGDASLYSVAWIDCVAKGADLGRSLVYLGEHASRSKMDARALGDPFPALGAPKIGVPVDLPGFTLNPLSVSAFNAVYYAAGARKADEPFLVAFGPYFFPLDGIRAWNRIYGRRGFVQHQCVLPPETAREAIGELLERIARRGDASFLAVLKKLGPSQGLISFARAGYTLALDFPLTPGLLPFLDELDGVVVKAGGRLYLAKDARQSRATFDAGYPGADEFRALRRRLDPAGHIASLLSSRLGL